MRTRTLLLLLLVGCGEPPPATLHAGLHRFEASIPRGWGSLQQGAQLVLQFESPETRLAFSDLGPGRPNGFRDEVDRARSLWRDGRTDEALTRLRDLRLRSELFASREDYEAFSDALAPLAGAKRGTPWSAVAGRFDKLSRAIDALAPSPIERIGDGVLSELERDRRREVRSREIVRIDGREALRIETWSALTHTDPRRYLLVLNDGRILLLRCERCEGESAEAFDAIAASLRFQLR
jgi:hypothetical protein